MLVQLDDRAEQVLERARATGAPRVQLLVPEGPSALQRQAEMDRLAALASAEGVGLVLISSDPLTLDAARRASIATLAVSGARVRTPDRAEAPASLQPPGRPAGADDAFLAALDDLDTVPGGGGVRAEEAAAAASIAAALREPEPPTVSPGEASGTSKGDPQRPRRTRPIMSDEELLAATLAAEPGMTPPRALRPQPPADPDTSAAPRPAPGRPDDVASHPLRPAPLTDPPERAARPRRPAVGAPLPGAERRPGAAAEEGQGAASPSTARLWAIIGVALGLLLLVAAIAAVLIWNNRVTVTVTPPQRPDTVEVISALPVPIAAPGEGATTAVAAAPISAAARFEASAEVTEVTLTPSGSASGALTIFNSSPQALTLPSGTEFIAVQPDGREVPFVSSGDVVVPGATTSDTGAQIITSRGQASVMVMARSPGSGSNVDGNTIRRVAPPGVPPFNVDSGSFIVQHPPLTGGSEEEVRIVKDSNVFAIMTAALEGLDAEGRRQLDAQAAARGLAVEQTTITPRRSELEQLQGFEYRVQPAVGQPLDPQNPRFTLTVEATYNGLGVPADQPLDQQLGPVVREVLLQAGRITAGDCRAPTVTGWGWDGERLLVEGQIVPDTLSPGCQGGLDAAALDQVREAVRGKSRVEAQAALDALVAQGLIGGYILPDVPRLPAWDWQLTITS